MEYFSWTAKKMDLLREGRREGREEGLAEGLQEGMQKGTLAARTADVERMADYILSHNTSFTREQALAEATACLTGAATT